MRKVAAILAVCLLATIYLPAQQSENTEPVAEVKGHKLTIADLEQREGDKLLQARYQFYLTERKALDDLIDDQLLQDEAKRQNLTLDQLLEKKVYSEVKDPTEDQLRVYYEGIGESQDTYEQVRQQILDHIRELRRNKARIAYVDNLRRQAQISILLMPPEEIIDVGKDASLGPKNAPVTLVEFADYECPYCEKVTPQLQQVLKEYGNSVSFVFKDFPLPMHHKAQKAAEAARCAGDQGKFWEYHDILFNSRLLGVADLKNHARVLKLDGDRFDKCLDDGAKAGVVKSDFEEGKRLGLTGTPSFFVNGHFFSGSVDYALLKQMIDQQLALTKTRADAVISQK
jgi:protein-disulfide isomerase